MKVPTEIAGRRVILFAQLDDESKAKAAERRAWDPPAGFHQDDLLTLAGEVGAVSVEEMAARFGGRVKPLAVPSALAVVAADDEDGFVVYELDEELRPLDDDYYPTLEEAEQAEWSGAWVRGLRWEVAA